jgi:DNA-binding LacI/PurR family transcriptional regulator
VGSLQVEHLAAAGHRRLGYALPDDERVQAIARPRLEGVQQACAELGLAEPLVLRVPLDPLAAAEAVRVWRSAQPPVTAVCCFNDNTALAVLAGMRHLGLAAPRNLAVVGVDDIPAARLASPPLTTVIQDMQTLATHVADTIAASLNRAPRARRPVPDMLHLVPRCSA